MEQEKILLQIESELVALRTFIRKLKPEAKLHQLDIDLLRQKARNMYELLLVLEPKAESIPKATVYDIKKPEPSEIPEQEIDDSLTVEKQRLIDNKHVVKAEEMMISDEDISHDVPESSIPVKEKIVENEPEKVIEPEHEAVEEKQEVMEEEQEVTIELEIEKPQPAAEPVMDKQPIVPQVPQEKPTPKQPVHQADLFSDSQETIADKFSSSSQQQTVADRLSHNNLKSLRQFIGINEKFLFINELFNGDMTRYNNAIDELDSMKTLEGANVYLIELQVQNQWQEDMEALIKLKDLLEKKFI